MIRTQILLTETQAAELRTLAAAEHRAMADLVREGVDTLLAYRACGGREHAKARALAAVGQFRSGVRGLATRRGDHLADAETR